MDWISFLGGSISTLVALFILAVAYHAGGAAQARPESQDEAARREGR